MVASVVDKQNFLHKKFDFWRAVRRVKPVDSEVLLINLNRIDLNMKEQKLWVELGEYPGREKQRKTQVQKLNIPKKIICLDEITYKCQDLRSGYFPQKDKIFNLLIFKARNKTIDVNLWSILEATLGLLSIKEFWGNLTYF